MQCPEHSFVRGSFGWEEDLQLAFCVQPSASRGRQRSSSMMSSRRSRFLMGRPSIGLWATMSD